MLLEALLAVFIEEELGIGQAGAQHALIAVLNRLEVFPAAVAHGDEERQQLACCILDREVTLMVAHRRDDGFRRQLQVFLLEFAAKGRRILHEIEDFFKQVFRNLGLAAIRLGDFLNLLADHGLALILIDDDEVLLAGRFVVSGRINREIALREEAVAAGRAARFDVGELKRDDILVIKGNEPADRADELEVEVAPAHVVREGEAADEFRQQRLEELCRQLAFLMDFRIDIAVFDDEVFRRDVLTAGKSLCSLRRLAVSIKGDLDGRAAVLARDIFLFLREALDEESRAARRTERADGIKGDAVLLECLFRMFLELGQCARHYMGRNLFRADFK